MAYLVVFFKSKGKYSVGAPVKAIKAYFALPETMA